MRQIQEKPGLATCIAALARCRKNRARQLGHTPGDAYDITKDKEWLFDWQGQVKKGPWPLSLWGSRTLEARGYTRYDRYCWNILWNYLFLIKNKNMNGI